MTPPLRRVDYTSLSARQQENYNFQKVSAVLADYGFSTIRLTDDWQGADFIAQHVDGETFLKVQLKSRLTVDRKYVGKGLHVAFPSAGDWYLYPHDDVLNSILAETGVGSTTSWAERGGYSFPGVSRQLRAVLAPFRIAVGTDGGEAV